MSPPPTDDEAFIRAIVTAPADEAPRLVYADWLDERGDPRAAYLRAEVAWAAVRGTKGAARLREDAAPLDPVWVATVSRPPVGVCLDQVTFKDCGAGRPRTPLTPAQVSAFEATHGIGLPADYRAFLLLTNGGCPTPNHVRLPGHPYPHPDGCHTVLQIYPLGPESVEFRLANEWFRAGRHHLWWTQHEPFHQLCLDVLPIGYGHSVPEEDELIGLFVAGPRAGQVAYFVRGGPGRQGPDPVFVPSFAAFLALFTDNTPAWIELISNGSRADVKDWLSAWVDPNAVYGSRSPLGLAVARGDAEIVRLLLAAGADPAGPNVRIRSWTPVEVRRLLTAARRPDWAEWLGAAEPADIERWLAPAWADVNFEDGGRSPLGMAVRRGDPAVVRLLLGYGARVTGPALQAARHCQSPAVRRLVSQALRRQGDRPEAPG